MFAAAAEPMKGYQACESDTIKPSTMPRPPSPFGKPVMFLLRLPPVLHRLLKSLRSVS